MRQVHRQCVGMPSHTCAVTNMPQHALMLTRAHNTMPGVAAQIANVAAWEAGTVEGEDATKCAAVAACSGAAQQVLLAVCTHPEHGLAAGAEGSADDPGGAAPLHIVREKPLGQKLQLG